MTAPSTIELQTRIASLEKDLKQAKREVDLREIALRRANGYLADRIHDVDELTKANRDLSEKLLLQPRKVPFDTLEQSREVVGAAPTFESDPRD